jgi:hypothetical protein
VAGGARRGGADAADRIPAQQPFFMRSNSNID